MLRLFEQSPAAYFHRFVSKRIPSPPPSDAQRLGTAIHAAILEPERFDEIVALIPENLLPSNGARKGNLFKEWKADHLGDRVALKRKEYDLIRWQVETTWANPACRDLLTKVTHREYSVFWTTDEGYTLRCRWDAACSLDAILVDLKRTRQTEATFWRAVRDFGYHKQAATYADGYRAMFDVDPQFQFLLIYDAPPFESAVRTLPQAAIDFGRQQNADTLKQLYECKRGERQWISEGTDIVKDLELPPWFLPTEPGENNVRDEY